HRLRKWSVGRAGVNSIVTSTDGTNWVAASGAKPIRPIQNHLCIGNGIARDVVVRTHRWDLRISEHRQPGRYAPGWQWLSCLFLEGPVGLDYTIQISADLIGCQTLTNFTSTKSTSLVFNAVLMTLDQLFYRVSSRKTGCWPTNKSYKDFLLPPAGILVVAR